MLQRLSKTLWSWGPPKKIGTDRVTCWQTSQITKIYLVLLKKQRSKIGFHNVSPVNILKVFWCFRSSWINCKLFNIYQVLVSEKSPIVVQHMFLRHVGFCGIQVFDGTRSRDQLINEIEELVQQTPKVQGDKGTRVQ